MKIKKNLEKILKSLADNTIQNPTVSVGGWGIEKMPKSLEKLR